MKGDMVKYKCIKQKRSIHHFKIDDGSFNPPLLAIHIQILHRLFRLQSFNINHAEYINDLDCLYKNLLILEYNNTKVKHVKEVEMKKFIFNYPVFIF